MGLSKGKDHPHCHEKSASLFPTAQCLLAGHPIEIIMVEVKPIGSVPSHCWCQCAVSLAACVYMLFFSQFRYRHLNLRFVYDKFILKF